MLEGAGEIGGRVEAELFGDAPDRQPRLGQELARLEDAAVLQKRAGRAAAGGIAAARQMGGGDAQGGGQSAVAPVQPDVGPQATAFFRNPNAETFRNDVNNLIDAMFIRGSDRDVMNRALQSRFGGSRENMDNAIRTHLFQMLTTRAAEMEANCGIRVTGTDPAQMQVQVVNQSRVTMGLRNTIRQFAMRTQ